MSIKTDSLTKMGLLLALIIVLGFIPAIPLGFVPVVLTVQNIGILLIGLVLTPLEAFLTTASFLLLVAVGLPLLTGMRGGFAVFMGPTCGYLIGYLIASVVLAYLTKKPQTSWWLLFLKIALAAVIIIDGLGMIGFAFNMHVSLIKAIELNAIFIPGDLIKSGIVAYFAQQTKS